MSKPTPAVALVQQRKNAAKVKRITHTLPEITAALRLHRGSIVHAAEELGIESSVLRRKVNATPSLVKVCDDIRQDETDKAERAVYELVDQKNPQATIFVVRTLGKERGFTEKNVVEHDLAPGAKSAAALVESMRKGAKQLVEDESIEVPFKVIDVKDNNTY